MNIDNKYIQSLKQYFLGYAEKRRDVIKNSGDALHQAKRAIFALHRDNKQEAEERLVQAREILQALRKTYTRDKNMNVDDEGSYRAALEEYVEAYLFFCFLQGKSMGKVDIPVPAEVYIAGLCDVPGELYRHAVKLGTEKRLDRTKQCAKVAQDIVGELTEFNLTKYLRNKFDQAKSAVKRIEYIVYELSLREE